MLAASCPWQTVGMYTAECGISCGRGHFEEGESAQDLPQFRNNLVMLYKNLPQEDLASVMRVRAVLDYVAAFSFMLKGQLPNALAVFRARRAYHSLRTSLAASRKENLKKLRLP